MFSISEVDAQRKCQSSDYVLGITDHFMINSTYFIVTKYEAGSDLSHYTKTEGLKLDQIEDFEPIGSKFCRGHWLF